VTEICGVVLGIDPDKTLVLHIKNASGSFYMSRIPLAAGIAGQIDVCLTWIGKTVKMTVEDGEIEAIELSE